MQTRFAGKLELFLFRSACLNRPGTIIKFAAFEQEHGAQKNRCLFVLFSRGNSSAFENSSRLAV